MNYHEDHDDVPRRHFKGVFIPAALYLDESLNETAKLIAVEIDSLDGPEGCYASNAYLAKRFKVSENYVSKCLSALRARGYVTQESFNGRRRVLRSHIAAPVSPPAATESKAELDSESKAELDSQSKAELDSESKAALDSESKSKEIYTRLSNTVDTDVSTGGGAPPAGSMRERVRRMIVAATPSQEQAVLRDLCIELWGEEHAPTFQDIGILKKQVGGAMECANLLLRYALHDIDGNPIRYIMAAAARQRERTRQMREAGIDAATVPDASPVHATTNYNAAEVDYYISRGYQRAHFHQNGYDPVNGRLWRYIDPELAPHVYGD